MAKPILLVEDDKGHAHLISKRLRREGLKNEIIHAEDGQIAVDMLFSDQEPPGVILLDLNLPRLSGVQVLEMLSHDAVLSQVPVIIMTTSDQPDDIRKCEQYNYADYIIKPPDYAALVDKILTLIH